MPKRTKEKLELVSGFSDQAPKDEQAELPKIQPGQDFQKVQISLFLMRLFPLFQSVPNMLGGMFPLQRQAFFESLYAQYAAMRMAGEKDREAGREKALASLIPLKVAQPDTGEAQKTGEKRMMAPGGIKSIAMPGSKSIAMLGYNVAQAAAVQQALGQAISEYAGNDSAKAQAAITEFELRLKAQGYKSEDLMAVLLLVLEDLQSPPEEGGIESSRPAGAGTKIHAPSPEMLRTTLQESAEVRLASVREMLRYYFKRHPGKYCRILASVLGVSADKENDVVYMGERLAAAIALIGSYALELRVLAEVKKAEKMDSQSCMRELGFKYDETNKKLIIGKRTCGGPLAPKDILRLLFSRLNRKNN